MKEKIKKVGKKKKYEEPKIHSVRLEPLEPNLQPVPPNLAVSGSSTPATAVS